VEEETTGEEKGEDIMRREQEERILENGVQYLFLKGTDERGFATLDVLKEVRYYEWIWCGEGANHEECIQQFLDSPLEAGCQIP